MKPNSKDTEFDKRRQISLEEFARVTEDLKSLLAASGKSISDEHVTSQMKQLVEEGHMFLSAVLQKEIASIVALHTEDKKTVTSINLARLLLQVHVYCDHVSTMKFPAEWESLLEEVNPKYKKEKEKRLQEKSKPMEKTKEAKEEGRTYSKKDPSSPKGKPGEDKKDDKLSPKTGGDEEESLGSEEAEDTQTVQIEIRGNTGGFVGSVIDFDLVVTHEDGSPVKVDASAFDVEISGPAANSKVTILAKDEGAFKIDFIPDEEGPNTLSIFMHEMLLTSGIRSIISRAVELAFLVHSKDISRGQLQGISVVPNAIPKETSPQDLIRLKLEGISQCDKILQDLRAKLEAELKELNN